MPQRRPRAAKSDPDGGDTTSEELDESVLSDAEEPAVPERRSALRFLKELPVLIVLALAIALLIKAFLVQAFYIPSASMEPTLTQGDRVLVNKLSYRFGKPARGDVIVFKDPYPDPCAGGSGDTSCDESIGHKVRNWFADVFGLPTGDTRDFIKRIVALPGETIAMFEGNVYVCDQPHCVPVDGKGKPKDGRLIDFPHNADKGPQKDTATYPAFVVPDSEYFVLGDNRANSSDSRTFHGIERKNVIGKAFVLVWPPGRFTGL